MRLAVIAQASSIAGGVTDFVRQLQVQYHDVSLEVLEPHQEHFDPSRFEGVELAILHGMTHVPVSFACVAHRLGIRLACPPLHTLILLDHPLHWRHVLEREGAPVCPWLLVRNGVSVERDPRLSVIGFPVQCSPAHPGLRDSSIANDRDELRAVTSASSNQEGFVVERVPQGELVTAFTGIVPNTVLLSPSLDAERATLTLGLARHVVEVLELFGPCQIALVWEPGRLLLCSVELIADLGTESDSFRAFGGDYPSFVAGVVHCASALQKRGGAPAY